MELSCKEVAASLGGNPIVKGIDLTVKEGEFIGIIGPNGSGKSTLLKCIYRVLKPSGGTIRLGNQDLNSLSVKESAKQMAVVAQHNYYNFDFTVQEVVLMGRAPHKKMLERDNADDYRLVKESLRQVTMSGFENRIFSSLSGGEQQRVILARALVQQTQFLILDEPTNHLDIKYQLQLLDAVKRLRLTVLAAFHDLNIAAMYCDKLYVMNSGRVIRFGTPKEVLTEQLLKELYEVNAKITEDTESGLLNIRYTPSYMKG